MIPAQSNATASPPSLPSPAQWFITGASGGLGRTIVEAALAQGDRVIATVRRIGSLDNLTTKYGARLTVEHLDVSRPSEVNTLTSRLLARQGPIDVVVNNAGYSAVGALEELSDAQILHQVETMLLSPIRITQALIAPMRARGYGRIIQISSMGGQLTYPGGSVYHAAKWGLEGFTEALSKELKEFGIRCTIVEPGATRTNFRTNMIHTSELSAYAGTPSGQFRQFISRAHDDVFRTDPHKVARAIANSTRQADPPLRLTLGADAYDAIRETLGGRLKALEEQEDLARAVEVD
jgi:NAD(P)-dependent dehydrogenase (short-subunit alcohol dehydrogenase family)